MLTLSDKVDFDILGVKNSMMKVGLEVEHVKAPWTDEDWGDVRPRRGRMLTSRLSFSRRLSGRHSRRSLSWSTRPSEFLVHDIRPRPR